MSKELLEFINFKYWSWNKKSLIEEELEKKECSPIKDIFVEENECHHVMSNLIAIANVTLCEIKIIDFERNKVITITPSVK